MFLPSEVLRVSVHPPFLSDGSSSTLQGALTTHSTPSSTSLASRHGLPRRSGLRGGSGISGSSTAHCSSVRCTASTPSHSLAGRSIDVFMRWILEPGKAARPSPYFRLSIIPTAWYRARSGERGIEAGALLCTGTMRNVLLRHKAVPLRKENGCLVVAMADPGNAHAETNLTTSAGHPISAVTEETAAPARAAVVLKVRGASARCRGCDDCGKGRKNGARRAVGGGSRRAHCRVQRRGSQKTRSPESSSSRRSSCR